MNDAIKTTDNKTGQNIRLDNICLEVTQTPKEEICFFH